VAADPAGSLTEAVGGRTTPGSVRAEQAIAIPNGHNQALVRRNMGGR
jgi:hypothetical protein